MKTTTPSGLTNPEMKIRFERSRKALKLKPSTGHKTASCTARITDGYTCLVEEGRWRMVSDLHEKVGGNGLGPDPSALGRAAFASCAAIGYVQWAAVLGIEIYAVEVQVETDHDYGGYYDTTDSPVGPLEVRTKVKIESDASESEIRELVEKADRHSPLHDIWARPLDLKLEIEVTKHDK